MPAISATDLGRLGEEMAAAFYAACGFTCVARRVRRARGELDLVVARPGLLVFVEVKVRGPGSWASAQDAVTRRQLGRMRGAAEAWLAEQPQPVVADLRCDVVAVQLGGEGRGLVLRHFPGVI